MAEYADGLADFPLRVFRHFRVFRVLSSPQSHTQLKTAVSREEFLRRNHQRIFHCSLFICYLSLQEKRAILQ
jgi:hypothetical protein